MLPGRFDLRVECPPAASLVPKVNYHPKWHVAIDGLQIPTFMVSPSFIGLAMPAGVHHVSAEYRSPIYKTALLLLGAGTFVATILLRRQFVRLDGLFSPRN